MRTTRLVVTLGLWAGLVLWLGAAACSGKSPTAPSSAAPATALSPDGEAFWQECASRWHGLAATACDAGTLPSGQKTTLTSTADRIQCRLGYVLGSRAEQLIGYGQRCAVAATQFSSCVARAEKGAQARCEQEGMALDGTRVDPQDAAAVAKCKVQWRDGTGSGQRGYKEQCAGVAKRQI
jgi:hypothetical protein